MCYNGPSEDCRYDHGESGAGHTKQPLMGHQDRLTTLKLHKYDVETKGAVTLYDGRDCANQSGAFFWESSLGLTKYNSEDIWEGNMYNRQTASFRLPYGYELTLYKSDGAVGESKTFYGFSYEDGTQEHLCQNTPDDWTDREWSISINKTGSYGGAVGYWRAVQTQTEALKFDVTYGVEYSTETETETSSSMTINHQMESSVSFLDFFSLGSKMSQEYAQSITEDVKSTQAYSTTYSYSLTCSNKAGIYDVGLWQWVTSTNDMKDSVYSIHTVCRYGENYNTPPVCPWNACLDGECTTCAEGWMA